MSPWISAHREHWATDLPATGPELVELLAQLDLRFTDSDDKEFDQAV